LKLALAKQLLKVDQPFPMADAKVTAKTVLREYVLSAFVDSWLMCVVMTGRWKSL
jgi:hypothetical protein